MDLFEIVSSYIPDEQKADIKAKIDGELENITKSNETKLKKELSKTYGVNFFADNVENAFSETQFVKKEKVENVLKELEAYKEKINEKEKEVNEYREQIYLKDAAIKLVKEGFREERLELIKPLLLKGEEGEKIEDRVARIKAEVPELFVQKGFYKAYEEGDGQPTPKDDLKLYWEKRKKEIESIKRR